MASKNIARSDVASFNASLKFRAVKPTPASRKFDKCALPYADRPTQFRAEPSHNEHILKKIVLDTKERLRHPFMCAHPMVYDKRSKLVKTCNCPNRPRKFQINLKQRGTDDWGDSIGDLGSVLIGTQRHDAIEHKHLKRAMNKLLLFIMLHAGFRDGRPDSSGAAIRSPDNSAIKLMKASLIKFGKPSLWWTDTWTSNIRYWDSQFVKTVGNGDLRSGMNALRKALIAFFFRAPCGTYAKPNPVQFKFEKKKKKKQAQAKNTETSTSIAAIHATGKTKTQVKVQVKQRLQKLAMLGSKGGRIGKLPISYKKIRSGGTKRKRSGSSLSSFRALVAASSNRGETQNVVGRAGKKSRLRFAQAITDSERHGAANLESLNSPSAQMMHTSPLQLQVKTASHVKAAAENRFLSQLAILTGRPVGFGLYSKAALPTDTLYGGMYA